VIIYDLTQSEENAVYQALVVDNNLRQYDFLKSMVAAAIGMQRPFMSSTLLKAFNFHAIACLHTYAGEWRPCEVKVGPHVPPPWYHVPNMMEDFVNEVNYVWEKFDPIVLASFVLWKLNFIHPFVNGNGRTARAACYFALCTKLGGWLKGETILPESLRKNHDEYVAAIRAADQSLLTGGLDLSKMHALISRLIAEQLRDEQEPAEVPDQGVGVSDEVVAAPEKT
jgi:hypothetical protein